MKSQRDGTQIAAHLLCSMTRRGEGMGGGKVRRWRENRCVSDFVCAESECVVSAK